MIKKLVKLFMVFVTFWSSISGANTLGELGSIGDIKSPAQASEYIFRSSPKESLISVQLLGAVQKPGVYYVPTNTDLVKVLTLAGGSTNGGDLSEVMIRKTDPEKWAKIQSKALDEHRGTYELDLQELLKEGNGDNLKLSHDDLIYVPPKESMVSPEVAKTITLVSVVMSIALTGLLISKYSHENE
ncbi:polysaccharide biosynthesis/export family protein [Bdellovibrio sp. HCB337]|uniref:polysaccharide biosynthesis/export family protein n=1 Tax=Bdellovibrio sp. HCB337 TaxID=3394358 RepID=UPI0039A41D6E